MINRSDISEAMGALKEKISDKMSSMSFGKKDIDVWDSDIEIIDPRTTPAPTKDPGFGVDPIVKTFYEGKNSNANYYDWTEKPPRQVSKKIAKANDGVAIKVYKVKDLDKPVVSGRFVLKYHMLEIQSPHLVNALCPIVKEQGVHLEPTDVATFYYPFRPLYFCSDKIMSLYKKVDEGSALKEHLGLLLKVMGEVFGGTHNHVKNLQTSKLISFKLAWAFYLKDSFVYSPGKDCERIRKVVDTSYKQSPGGKPMLVIKCKEIVFDGDAFIWKNNELEVGAFDGNKPITELAHYPLSFHDDPKSVTDRLTARGKRVLDYQGLTYLEYEGLAIYEDDMVGIEKHNVTGRILIDTYGYNKHHLALQRRGGKDLDSMNNLVVMPNNNDPVAAIIDNPIPPAPHPHRKARHPPVPNIPAVQKPKSLYIRRLTDEEQAKNKNDMLARGEDLVFVSPLLPGYALKNKLWCKYTFLPPISLLISSSELLCRRHQARAVERRCV